MVEHTLRNAHCGTCIAADVKACLYIACNLDVAQQ